MYELAMDSIRHLRFDSSENEGLTQRVALLARVPISLNYRRMRHDVCNEVVWFDSPDHFFLVWRMVKR